MYFFFLVLIRITTASSIQSRRLVFSVGPTGSTLHYCCKCHAVSDVAPTFNRDPFSAVNFEQSNGFGEKSNIESSDNNVANWLSSNPWSTRHPWVADDQPLYSWVYGQEAVWRTRVLQPLGDIWNGAKVSPGRKLPWLAFNPKGGKIASVRVHSL